MPASVLIQPQLPALYEMDEVDRKIVLATQDGLPLVSRPWHVLAEQLRISPGEVMQRVSGMQDAGIIRRIAAVPNHYALGYVANGMSVWNVADDQVRNYGTRIGDLEFVSHCYHRPRHLPLWPYNLFAMVHGQSRDVVEEKVAMIAAMLGRDNLGHEILYSTRILKKTGLRLRDSHVQNQPVHTRTR